MYQKNIKYNNKPKEYRNYVNLKMSNQKDKKSGSGKASSLTEYESMVDQAKFHIKKLDGKSIYGRLCEHDNVYGYCQQCEIRIRNQDILDRIDYINDKNVGGFPYSLDIASNSIYLTTKSMITSIGLEYFLKEFGNFFFNNPDFHISKWYE